MIKEILKEHEERMQKAIDALRREYSTLRAGRATPALFDKVMVEYYGSIVPINQVANVSVPEPRLLVISPWEKQMLHEIEKAIMKSDLELSPSSDGNVIRLAIPQLTEERRKDLVKVINKKGEEGKIALRNIRRDGNDEIKALEKSKDITEDESKKAQEDLQKIVDRYVEQVNEIKEAKEKEIMAI